MGEVSAIPSELEGWSGWTQGLNGNLTAIARDVNDAVMAFNGTTQEPSFIGQIPTIGDDLATHAARNQVVDQWVGQVGHAFETLDHLNVPPQVYKANMEDFGHGLVKVPESMITKQVGGDPVRDAQDAANGTKLAFQVRDAQARGDNGQVQALLAQLANQGAAFSFAFFQNLGPDGTIRALIDISALQYSDGEQDQARFQSLLNAFDSALGQATNNPDWNPAFTRKLFDRTDGSWGNAPDDHAVPGMQLNLLRYGVYSEDFLTQGADSFLFPDFKQPDGADVPSDVNKVIFDALDRNPDAAYSYLTGHHPLLDDSDLARVQVLFRGAADLPSDAVDSLARMIRDAGLSTTASWDDGRQLLQAIGEEAGLVQTFTPTALRQAVADLIANHVDVFVPPDPDAKVSSQWTWQEYLFKLTESDGEGHVNWDAVSQIQDAMSHWALTHGPTTFDSKNDANVKDWTKYLKEVGVLYGLTALPIKQAPYDADKVRESQIQFISTLISFIPFGSAVPGEHAGIEYLVDQSMEKTRVYLENHPPVNLGNPDAEAANVYYEQATVMRQALATQWLAHHPALIPPGTSKSDFINNYVTPLAEGKNPFGSNADVDQFLLDLGTADDLFHNQFGLPTTR